MKLAQLVSERHDDDSVKAAKMVRWAQSFTNAVGNAVGSLCVGMFIGRANEAFTLRFRVDEHDDTDLIMVMIEKLLQVHPTEHFTLVRKPDITEFASHGSGKGAVREMYVRLKTNSDWVLKIIPMLIPDNYKFQSK